MYKRQAFGLLVNGRGSTTKCPPRCIRSRPLPTGRSVLCVPHQVSGHAFGGEVQREVLERLRLDMADGTLDGRIDVLEHAHASRAASP